jgi:FKBP-type peptidyl-prolyl cis-trans isomerase
MRTLSVLALLLSATTLLAQPNAKLARPDAIDSVRVPLATELDSVSYAVGLNIGIQALRDSIELNASAIAAGIRDAHDTTRSQLSPGQIELIMRRFQQRLMAEQADRLAVEMAADSVAAIQNKAEGIRFLAENRKRPGVKTLPNGVQYRVITEGSGPKPKARDTVVVHYIGRLIDGTVFDNSIERGEPATFTLDSVIEGWSSTLPKMKVGSKWEVFIPADRAYGSSRIGGIPGNSTLIFEVELLGIRR